MKLKSITVAAALAAALTASVAAGSPGAAPKTGTWTGDLAQEIVILDPSTGETVESEWTKRFTISVLNGRIVRLYTTARSVCPGPAVRDHRVAGHWFTGRGPKLTSGGGFRVKLKGVEIAGALFASSGAGRVNISSRKCQGKGTWTLKRRL